MNNKINRRQMILLSSVSVLSSCSILKDKGSFMKKDYDVIIIGGGPAGLTAALTLARGGRSALVMDEGKARNAPASHMMNFPSRDGTPPEDFKALIKKDLSRYPKVEISSTGVEEVTRTEAGFIINGSINCRRVILAHGIKDILPDIPGFKQLWGQSIYHCPYCHGYEHRNGPIGFVADDENAANHYAALLKGLSDDLIFFSNGKTISDTTTLEKKGIKIYTEKIQELVYDNKLLIAVKLESGLKVERDCLFFRPPHKLTTDIGINLGCELDEQGLYKVDSMGATTQAGVYAVGDISTPMQSVLMACASGSKTGAMVNYSIMHEDYVGEGR
jgi:thioredoxin reductase